MPRVKVSGEITDAMSPDSATCEHCGASISWDEICYTHDESGFAECGVIVEGGTLAVSYEHVRVVLDPKIAKKPGFETNAEPTTWFRDAA